MNSTDIKKGTLHEATLFSQHLQASERLVIYTPGRYTPLYSYPVLYVLDGDDYLALGRLPGVLDQLTADKSVQDVIAVFLPVDKTERYARYHHQGASHHAFKRFLAEEVVSYIDSYYSTHPLGGARILLGDSLAATASLSAAFTYPHTFGQAASQSGAFDAAFLQACENLPGLEQLTVYLEAGTDERHVATSSGPFDFLAATQQMHDLLKEKGATLQLNTFAGDHTWTYWQGHLPDICRFFLA